MSSDTQIDDALEAVITAARSHRAVLASSASTPEQIWAAYVDLNNASVLYDDLISTAFDEVTPWDCEYIEDNEFTFSSEVSEPAEVTPEAAPTEGAVTICVRHRRDYTVPNPTKLVAAANMARARMAGGPETEITHLGQAVYALIDAGDGTVAALDDVDELEPGNGLLLVNELASPTGVIDTNVDRMFVLDENDRLLYRLNEVMIAED